MTDWNSVPVFGAPTAGAHTTIRPSAYGIINDSAGRIAVVRTPLGLFLPGGGSDDAELPEATVVRETREECGLAVRVGAWRRTAIEYVYSVTERTHFEKRSTFCDASVLESVGPPIETDHALEWMPASTASALLTPPSHRWAVSECLAMAPVREPSANDTEWSNQANWHCFNLFYASRRDSRPFVPQHPNRWTRSNPALMGATPNFANLKAYAVLGLILAPLALLGGLLVYTRRSS